MYRVHNEQPLAASNTPIGSIAAQFAVYEISPSALLTLERAVGGITGPTGSLGPTGPPGPAQGGGTGITGSVQYYAGDGLGTLVGTSRFMYDGVQTVSLNGQPMQGILVGPGTGLYFNNNLTVSNTSVYTSRNILDDGLGNGRLQGTVNVGSLTGSMISATSTIYTPSLFVNGINLQRPVQALVTVNNSSTGNLTFGSIAFSAGGTFAVGGTNQQALTLPKKAASMTYLVNLCGTGQIPPSSTSATLILNAPLGSLTQLYQGSVNNFSTSTPQALTTQTESLLVVGANVVCVLSASTNIFTSFQGRIGITQLI